MERQGLTAIEAVLQRERQPFRHIGVRPLSPIIGAEVEGLDLRSDLTGEERAELCRAYREHHVLVFRDQLLSEEDHLRIAGLIGEVRGRRWAVSTPGPDAGEAPEPMMLAERWRADETYRATPPAASLLHIHRLPRLGAGGDMMFANMHLAYDLLSEPLQALLSGLTAVHAPSFVAPAGELNATAEHPVVIRHPVTGRPAVFVNRQHTSHIVQIDPAHSEATLNMLFRHLESHPVLTCRIRWTPHALVVWDNYSTQHLTLQDFRPPCLAGHVVSIDGERPEPWSPGGIQ